MTIAQSKWFETPAASNSYPKAAVSVTSELSGQPQANEPLDRVYVRLRELQKLAPGWDGHNALAVDNDIARFAAMVVAPLMAQGVSVPFIAPLSSGGLQFEWHSANELLEVEIIAPYEMQMLIEDQTTGAVVEEPIRSDNIGYLVAVLKKIKADVDGEPDVISDAQST